jgi:hypothetical protein
VIEASARQEPANPWITFALVAIGTGIFAALIRGPETGPVARAVSKTRAAKQIQNQNAIIETPH